MQGLAPGLLVATPPLGDPNFERAVVLLAAHSEDGAFGWIINGEELMSMAELLEQTEVVNPLELPTLDVSSANIHSPTINSGVRSGGPVGTEQVWLLYPTSKKLLGMADQFDVGGGITACSSRRMLEALVKGRAPVPMIGVAGYAGWGPSQLEDEIRIGSWLPTNAEASLLFDVESSEIWLRAYERAGTSALAFTSRVVGSA